MAYFLFFVGVIITIGSFVLLKKYREDEEFSRICKIAAYIGIAIFVSAVPSLLEKHQLLPKYSLLYQPIIFLMFAGLAHFLLAQKRS